MNSANLMADRDLWLETQNNNNASQFLVYTRKYRREAKKNGLEKETQTRAAGTISKTFRKYLSNVPEK